MKVVETIDSVRAEVQALRTGGLAIGFAPTMGALHPGHISLIRAAREREGWVAVSIFVNPTQFGPEEDFDAYPRDIEADLEILAAEGVDLVFTPGAAEIYPDGSIGTTVDPGPIALVCEGVYRPGHFAGVATVCCKLFNIIRPDRVYLGQKDAQQVAVLRQMVADLNMPEELVVCPTVREGDGLAMSSRNRRLDPAGRHAAVVLPRALAAARASVERGESDAGAVAAAAVELIAQQPGVSLQYLEVVDPSTFEAVDRIGAESLIVLAAFVGSVRLIDNMVVGTRSRA